jgi:regulatory protein
VSSTITALKMKGKRSKKVVIHLDEEPAFSLAPVLAATLRVGQTLNERQIAELKDRQALEEAYQRALSLLSRRPRSEFELRQYFKRRKTPSHIAELVLQRLDEHGLVDDQAFARAWVENRAAFRPRGPWALRGELRQKGVSSEIIEAALEGFDQEAVAYSAARKIAPRWREFTTEEFRRRLNAYLTRRGFDYEILSRVIARVEREIDARMDESEDVT